MIYKDIQNESEQNNVKEYSKNKNQQFNSDNMDTNLQFASFFS